MCKPIKDLEADFRIDAADLPPPDKIGSCGRRCRECKLSAMTAALIGAAGPALHPRAGLELRA